VTELNSNGNDAGIYLTSDRKTALFASDRSGGRGGVDFYRAVRASTSSSFSTPQALSGLNSTADDIDPQLTADPAPNCTLLPTVAARPNGSIAGRAG